MGMTGDTGTLDYKNATTSGVEVVDRLANGVTVVVHAGVAATARPAGAASVIWVGSISPENATSADIYLATGGTTAVGFAAA